MLCPRGAKDYRQVVLMSHIMKTLEWLHMEQLRPMVRPHLNPLQFASAQLEVEYAIVYLLNQVYVRLDKLVSTVRVMFLTSPLQCFQHHPSSSTGGRNSQWWNWMPPSCPGMETSWLQSTVRALAELCVRQGGHYTDPLFTTIGEVWDLEILINWELAFYLNYFFPMTDSSNALTEDETLIHQSLSCSNLSSLQAMPSLDQKWAFHPFSIGNLGQRLWVAEGHGPKTAKESHQPQLNREEADCESSHPPLPNFALRACPQS